MKNIFNLIYFILISIVLVSCASEETINAETDEYISNRISTFSDILNIESQIVGSVKLSKVINSNEFIYSVNLPKVLNDENVTLIKFVDKVTETELISLNSEVIGNFYSDSIYISNFIANNIFIDVLKNNNCKITITTNHRDNLKSFPSVTK